MLQVVLYIDSFIVYKWFRFRSNTTNSTAYQIFISVNAIWLLKYNHWRITLYIALLNIDLFESKTIDNYDNR
jgi:hypothetical protein